MEKSSVYALIGESWGEHLHPFFKTKEFVTLTNVIHRDNPDVFPKKDDIFRVFKETKLEDIKVVIIGQDPYPGSLYDGTPYAMGRAFAVKYNEVIPQSLKNIVKELSTDIDKRVFTSGFDYSLQHWVDQGVFLLNSALTVKKGNAGSHSLYWKEFTKLVIETINSQCNNVVFLLWGSHAKSFKKYLTNTTFRYVETVHPSPLSAHKGFLGSKCFSEVNKHLGIVPINWVGLKAKFYMIKPEEIKILPYDGQEKVK